LRIATRFGSSLVAGTLLSKRAMPSERRLSSRSSFSSVLNRARITGSADVIAFTAACAFACFAPPLPCGIALTLELVFLSALVAVLSIVSAFGMSHCSSGPQTATMSSSLPFSFRMKAS
jgi:hypothetical protein